MTSEGKRLKALEAAGLVHPRIEAVTAALFDGTLPFFYAADKVQVKYEMLRAHLLERVSVVDAARAHGYSRASFYLVMDAFSEKGMTGLLDERRGRHGPIKVTEEVAAFLAASKERSTPDLMAEVEARFGVVLHRRTIERARGRRGR